MMGNLIKHCTAHTFYDLQHECVCIFCKGLNNPEFCIKNVPFNMHLMFERPQDLLGAENSNIFILIQLTGIAIIYMFQRQVTQNIHRHNLVVFAINCTKLSLLS